jgi:hypothetical protein
MEQQTATKSMQAEIHWSNDKICVDDSEPVVGTVVEDSDGQITIKDSEKEVFHQVFEGSNGDLLLRSKLTLNQRDRDTTIKGTVDDVEVQV